MWFETRPQCTDSGESVAYIVNMACGLGQNADELVNTVSVSYVHHHYLHTAHTCVCVCVLSDESPEQGGSGEGPAVLIRDGAVDVALEEGEHGEPDAGAAAVLVGARVSEGVVIQEETRGDVERDEDVDGVMLVSCQDEEDPEKIQHPRQSVDEVPAPGSVYRTHTHTITGHITAR